MSFGRRRYLFKAGASSIHAASCSYPVLLDNSLILFILYRCSIYIVFELTLPVSVITLYIEINLSIHYYMPILSSIAYNSVESHPIDTFVIGFLYSSTSSFWWCKLFFDLTNYADNHFLRRDILRIEVNGSRRRRRAFTSDLWHHW